MESPANWFRRQRRARRRRNSANVPTQRIGPISVTLDGSASSQHRGAADGAGLRAALRGSSHGPKTRPRREKVTDVCAVLQAGVVPVLRPDRQRAADPRTLEPVGRNAMMIIAGTTSSSSFGHCRHCRSTRKPRARTTASCGKSGGSIRTAARIRRFQSLAAAHPRDDPSTPRSTPQFAAAQAVRESDRRLDGEPLQFDLDTGSNDRRTALMYRGYGWAGGVGRVRNSSSFGAGAGSALESAGRRICTIGPIAA